MEDKSLLHISVVGHGNVATHLHKWLQGVGYEVNQINSRTLEGLDTNADICVLAVSDSAIEKVALACDALLKKPEAIIAHTAGSVPMAKLRSLTHHTGVLYPMQTFTKERALSYEKIPVFVEGDTDVTSGRLMALASAMTENARQADSDTRARIHLGAVFACNYVNYMLYLATRMVHDSGLGLDVYAPLVEETVDKALSCGPFIAQTGPARRGDLSTLWAHMDLLRNHPHASRVCRLLSQQILNLYKDQ